MNIEKLKKYGIWLVVIVIVVIGFLSRLSDEEEKDKIRKEDPSIVEKQKPKEKFSGEVPAYSYPPAPSSSYPGCRNPSISHNLLR